MPGLKVFLVDGTYELFRMFYGAPSHVNGAGQEVAAARGVVSAVVAMIDDGATHIGVATDHVIESFRNDLWPGYKTGEGVDPVLKGQFGLLEDALDALGVALWPMVEREADDALASAAAIAAADPTVEQVSIWTPDKDLAQCVDGSRVVQVDRRKKQVIDEDAVRARYGISPRSIPDWLALVGDSADGFPGLPGWGAKTASAVLATYDHIEDIPDAPGRWEAKVRGAPALAATLAAHRGLVALFKELATLRRDPPVIGGVADLRWSGPRPGFAELCQKVFDQPSLAARAERLAGRPG